MQLDATTPVLRSDRVAWREVDGRVLVVLTDSRRVHTLNEVGSRIWALADGRSLADIVEVITAEFEADRETADRDARRFVSELAGEGALLLGEP